LGYIAGAPNKLTYVKDVHRYMRELEKASKRVEVFVMGRSEEGRETLLVAISDEANLARLDRLKQVTARLADPRKTSAEEAAGLIAEGLPFYWASGAIHSPETGSPEMLMELAYRLAVEESPLIRNIRANSVVLITPVLEVDGRDKQVDIYNYKKAHPDRVPPGLVYWGRYVAHDNNRDGMALSLALSRNVVRTFLDYHPQVVHDLHESVPFLYISTGMGPYNAWLDPITINEWQKMAYHEVEEMTKRGVPGVWTHGFYDGWGANYMLSTANSHNSIGRFYETFGIRGADTVERKIDPSATTRTWFRPNPPLEKVKWSLRNNVNLQQSALLLGMSNVASNRKTFLENFYLKSQRSVAKAATEGPSAWVISGDDPRPAQAAELVNLLRLHGVEVHRTNKEITSAKTKFPSGSFVVRMDQPYSRAADMMLDTQYFNVSDPRPYDDTGWSLGALRHVKTVRTTEAAILREPMTLLTADAKPASKMSGRGPVYVIRHNTDNTLATFRFALTEVPMYAAQQEFEAGGAKYPAGSMLIPAAGAPADLYARLERSSQDLGLRIDSLEALPGVSKHKLAAPRIALVHTWISTQNEGWYRIAFDKLRIPYTYISDQKIAQIANLRERFDVIIFGPVAGPPQRIVNGIPKLGSAPIPWKNTELTPNLGASPDQTDDMRGGLGLEGLAKIRSFVEEGGLFVTVGANCAIPITFGMVEGVSVTPAKELQVRGSVVNAMVTDRRSPITYGYPERIAVYFNQEPLLQVTSNYGVRQPPDAPRSRPSGRGTAGDPDIPQGRAYVAPLPVPERKPGEDPPMPEDMQESLRAYVPSPAMRPRVVLRFAGEKDLLVSGMLAGGQELASRPAVVDVPIGKGHILLFANNPVWRDQTQGSYFLLFNAMLHFDNLGVGR